MGCITQTLSGEYSEHTPDADYVCTLCGVLDQDSLIEELQQVRAERDALRVGVAALVDDHRGGAASEVRGLLSALLDGTSITGE